METIVTTSKNNLGHPGATAPGFMIGGRLPAVKEEVVFTSCHRCFQLIFILVNILAN
jgi:hypothetical protein